MTTGSPQLYLTWPSPESRRRRITKTNTGFPISDLVAARLYESGRAACINRSLKEYLEDLVWGVGINK